MLLARLCDMRCRRRIIFRIFFILSVGLFAWLPVHSQRYISFGVGLNSYVGELSPSSRQRLNPIRGDGELNVRIGYTRYLREKLFIDASVNVGAIEGSFEPGDDIDPEVITSYPNLNRFFRTSLSSLEFTLNWIFTDWQEFDLYGGVGMGVLSFRVEDENNRNLRLVPNTRAEGETYDNITMMVPINAGIILFKNRRVNLLFQVSWNLTNTDYLDNIGRLGQSGNDSVLRNLFMVRYGF